MTQFEKEFVLACLDFFTQILSNDEVLQQAIVDFSGTQVGDCRYLSNASISDSELWDDADKLKFSAAFFEATARANYHYVTDPGLSMQATQAQNLWEQRFKPLLASNTEAKDRIKSIIQNCNNIKTEVKQEEPSDAPQHSSQDNRYTFFTALAAIGVATAVGAAIVFKP
ncbi:hypothetical protein ELY21_10695 [Legionella sp. km535]|uniref:hypothetical protein n=1 Tax=Legionella sp. km535 TaxID=2498107 RepID=UPI000F8F1C46|nr:hypothetical protein [Legionella sp. km535]RUR17609.1 hypothetical protein ELY21_10695 [Legionella sp. km535]